MYHCSDCNGSFEFVRVYFEPTPSGEEKFLLCPFCDSLNFSEERGHHCKYCGDKIKEEGEDYCSVSCRRAAFKLLAKQRAKEEKRLKDPLYKAINEVDEYNRRNKCRLSYGQYFALKEAKML